MRELSESAGALGVVVRSLAMGNEPGAADGPVLRWADVVVVASSGEDSARAYASAAQDAGATLMVWVEGHMTTLTGDVLLGSGLDLSGDAGQLAGRALERAPFETVLVHAPGGAVLVRRGMRQWIPALDDAAAGAVDAGSSAAFAAAAAMRWAEIQVAGGLDEAGVRDVALWALAAARIAAEQPGQRPSRAQVRSRLARF